MTHRCASPHCPGYPYAASLLQHPRNTCGPQPDTQRLSAAKHVELRHGDCVEARELDELRHGDCVEARELDMMRNERDALRQCLTELTEAAEYLSEDFREREEDGPLMPGQARALELLRAAIMKAKS